MEWGENGSNAIISTNSKSGLKFKVRKSVFPEQFMAHAGMDYLGSFETQLGAIKACKNYDDFAEKMQNSE